MKVSRRGFLAGAAGAGLGFGLGALSHEFPLPSPAFGPEWQPGEQTFVTSTCTLCPSRCGIRARLVDGIPRRIDGNPLHPVSQGGLCAKGRAGIQLLYHPDRIQTPLQRVGERGGTAFEPIPWDAAFERMENALHAARADGGPNGVEWVVGEAPGAMGEIIAGFGAALGATSTFVDDYRDGSAEVLRLCQGIDSPPAFDLEASDLVLSFGAGLSESWWSLAQAARTRASEEGAPRWIQADTRLSRTAVSADEWVPVRPGSFGALALGIAYFLLKEGLYDAKMISKHVSGWEDWTDSSGAQHLGFRRLVLRHGRPDFVTATTGVPLARLVALAKSFGRAQRPIALWDHAVSWHQGGMADALAIHALNVFTGRLNQPGGLLIQPALPVEPLTGAASGGGRGLAGSPLASSAWPAEIDDASRSPASVVFLYKSNPVASMGKGQEVAGALEKAGLVVSFSPFLDESARHADLILPDHTYLERWEDAPAPATIAYPVWGIVQPVSKPLHDTRNTGDVVLDLARRLGGATAEWARWNNMEQIVQERGLALAGAHRGSAFVPGYRRQELRELEGRGWWMPHGKSDAAYSEEIRESGGWFDPFYDYHDRSATSQHSDGRIWIFPPEARNRLRDSGPDLAEGFLPATSPTPDAGKEFPLRLLPYRVMTLGSGSTALMPWLMENLGVLTGDSWDTWVEINPDTAAELGLHAGERVRVESAHGTFDAMLQVFTGAQPGVVNAPYGLHTSVKGWGEHRGANPLAAIGGRSDGITGLPDWYSTDVRVIAA